MVSSRQLLALVVGSGIAASAGAQQPAQQEQAQAPLQLEQIVVTAERVQNDLQKTPVSVLKVSGEDMFELGVENVQQLAKFMPNVSVGPSANGGQPNYSIRGVSQINTGIGGDRSVGFYVDGLYFPRTTGTLMRALDIASIQVLRGPQGTLFGRNNTGGAIVIKTKKPTHELGGNIRLGLGSYNRRDLNGVVNVPISDHVMFRGSLALYNKDGYLEGANGQTKGDVDDTLWRTAFRFEMTDNATLDLSYTDVKSDKTGFPINYRGTVNPYDLSALACEVANPTACPNPGPTQLAPFVKFGPNLNWVGVPVDLDSGYKQSLKITGDPFSYVGGLQEHNNIHTRFVNATINWNFAQHLSLQSISGGIKIDTDKLSDSDGTPWPLGKSTSSLSNESWSQELHVHGDGYFNGRLDFLAGLYYFHEEDSLHSWSQSYGTLGKQHLAPWQVATHASAANPTPAPASFPLLPGDNSYPWYQFASPFAPPGTPTTYFPKGTPLAFIHGFIPRPAWGFIKGVCPTYYPSPGPISTSAYQSGPNSQALMGCINTNNLGLSEPSTSMQNAATDSKGIFLNFSLAATDKLTVSAGARYTEDEKTWYTKGATTTYDIPLTKNTGDWHSTDWRFVLQYQVMPNVMTYATVAKAYKAGGLNTSVPFGFGGFAGFTYQSLDCAPGTPPPAAGTPTKTTTVNGRSVILICARNPLTGEVINSPYIAYKPESVVNHEIGLRSEWFNHRFRANVTIFSMDYNDKQEQVIILPGQTGGNTDYANSFGGGPLIINAAKVAIDGIETEFTGRVTNNLTLMLAYAHLNARYEELNPLLIQSGTLFLDTPLPRAPEFSYHFQIKYHHAMLGGMGAATLGYAYTAEQWSGTDENTEFYLPALGLTNLNLSYAPSDANWRVGLQVRNLLNEEYLNGGFDISSFGSGKKDFLTGGADIIFPGAPRQIFANFTYNFGG